MFRRVFAPAFASFKRIELWQWIVALVLQQFGTVLSIGDYAGTDLFASDTGIWEYLIININTYALWLSLGAMVLSASCGVLHRDDAMKCMAQGSRARFAVSNTVSALLTVLLYMVMYFVITVLLGALFFNITALDIWKSNMLPERFTAAVRPSGAFFISFALMTAYLFVLMQLCMCINLMLQKPVGSIAGCLLLGTVLFPLWQADYSLAETFMLPYLTADGGMGIPKAAVLWSLLVILSAPAAVLSVSGADMLMRAREGET